MDDDYEVWMWKCIFWTVLVSAILMIAVGLAGCQSTNAPKWEMYRLDKHYKPHRVL